MSNYKNLVPVALVFFAAIGCYTRINESAEKQKEYNQYLETARNYRSEKIYVDAMDNYHEALEMKNSLEVCEEIGEMWKEADDYSQMESWGKYMVSTYPKNVEGYEYLVDFYLSDGNYKKCFSYYDISQKRGLSSETLTDKINQILYEYKIEVGGYDTIEEYSNGFAAASKKGLFGYINTNGKWQIKPTYQYAGPFCRDYAPIQDVEGEFYYVDKEGNRRMNYPQNLGIDVTKIGYVGNGEYAVGNDSTVFIVDTDGNKVSGPYEDAGAYCDGRAAVKKDGKWYMADLKGTILSDGYISFSMDVKRDVFRNGIAFAQSEKGFVMLNIDGKPINKKTFEDAKCFLDDTYAAVKQNGLWGFINAQGDMVIEPVYEEALSFANGFAAVKQNGLWGYINLDGVMVIKPAFAGALSMNDKGCCFVQKEENDQWRKLQLIRYSIN